MEQVKMGPTEKKEIEVYLRNIIGIVIPGTYVEEEIFDSFSPCELWGIKYALELLADAVGAYSERVEQNLNLAKYIKGRREGNDEGLDI